MEGEIRVSCLVGIKLQTRKRSQKMRAKHILWQLIKAPSLNSKALQTLLNARNLQQKKTKKLLNWPNWTQKRCCWFDKGKLAVKLSEELCLGRVETVLCCGSFCKRTFIFFKRKKPIQRCSLGSEARQCDLADEKLRP